MTRLKLVGGVVWGALLWPIRTVNRMITLAWMVGCITVGSATSAAADNDGLFGDVLPGTVLEQYGPNELTLTPLNLSNAHHGTPWIEEGMWSTLHMVGKALLWLVFSLVKGAIIAMKFMLNITVYRDNSNEIDAAVQSLAGSVFWPLLGVTVAWAGLQLFLNARRSGSGSIIQDSAWALVAGMLAVTFATQPSRIADDLDDIRTTISDAAITGYSNYAKAGDSAAGIPTVTYPATSKGAADKLGDSMWNVYAVTPWCMAAFGPNLAVCKDVGHDFLSDSDRWKQIDASTHERGENDDASPPCADELKGECDWVRGQSAGRMGMILFTSLIGAILAGFLLALVVFGFDGRPRVRAAAPARPVLSGGRNGPRQTPPARRPVG